MKWYLKCIQQYTDFGGRARRTEYWMFILFNALFAMAATLIDHFAGIAMEETGYGPVYGIYVLFALLPSVAVSVRRLHDVGKSGWMLLLVLIPLIGAIYLFVLSVTDGDSGENKWGPNPKETSTSLEDEILV